MTLGSINSSSCFVGRYAGCNGRQVSFGRKSDEYENPISRSTERNLAIISASGISLVAGTIAGVIAKGVSSTKAALITGGLTAAATLALMLPGSLYRAKVKAFTEEKEMDVFSRDRNVKTTLLEDMDKEANNKEVPFDKKLDDHLKLQTANRGSAVMVQTSSSNNNISTSATNNQK